MNIQKTVLTYYFVCIMAVVMSFSIFMSLGFVSHAANTSPDYTYYYEYTFTETSASDSSKKTEYFARYEMTSNLICAALITTDSSNTKMIKFYDSTSNINSITLNCVECNVISYDLPCSFPRVGSAGRNFYYDYGDSFPNITLVAKSNMPIFDNSQDLDLYFETGDTSNAINNFDIDLDNTEQFDSEYSLKGFKCNKTVSASWTGATTPSKVANENQTVREYVKVYADYENVSEEVTVVPLSDLKFSKAYSELSSSSKPLRSLRFVPMYSQSDGIFGSWFHGNVITVSFNENGGISNIDMPDVSISENGTLNPELEIPRIRMIDDDESDLIVDTPKWSYMFVIDNASEDLNIEVQGRWYTVDDIELYKESGMWKYKYSSILKNNLSTWVSYNDAMCSTGQKDLCKLGEVSWNNLLQMYPIEKRSYTGGTNSLGNFLFGYNDALSMLKETLLPYPSSLFNGCEIYVRFWYEDKNGIHYSKWTHWFDNLADSAGSSGSSWDDKENQNTENQSEDGLTDDEKDSIEDTGDSKTDTDAVPSINDLTDDVTSIKKINGGIKSALMLLNSLVSSLGKFPSWIATIFGFLPSWCILVLGLAITICVILRILGR